MSARDDRIHWDEAEVEPAYSIVCPSCFSILHERNTGKRTTWRIVPDAP